MTEKNSNSNKTRSVLVILIIVVVAIFCVMANNQSKSTDKPTTTTRTYTVNKSTGLYASADVDAEMIAELSIGTKLKPVGGSLNCVKFTDAGMDFNLCKMQVVSTGETGWVLRKWFE